jgi:hypothetical protein
MIKGFENITFKPTAIRGSDVTVANNSIMKRAEIEDESKECSDCGTKHKCWYRELEIRCGEMRGGK